MRKILFVVCAVVLLFPACIPASIAGNKYYYNAYTNITPALNSTFFIGSPTLWWDSAYIEHLYTANGTIGASNVTTPGGTTDYVAKFNTSTNIVNSDIKDNATSVYVLDKLNLQGDLYTDRWLNHDSNTFVGVDVAGGDGLRHVGGVEGQGNTALGYKSLYSINTSYYNTAIGYFALTNLTNGLYNTAVGQGALADVTTGQFNTAVGLQALNKNTGNYNTAVGLMAGHTNVVGDNNIFIGAQAGKNEVGSNKLYIDSSDTATPLIGGDFNTNIAVINGALDMATHQINNVVNPTLNQDAATKLYVDTAVGIAGTGNVTASGTANYVPKFSTNTNITNSSIQDSGTVVTFSTNVSAGSHYFNNLLDPSSAQDAATKNYVDTHGATPANTFTVSPSGANYTTIQAALTANPTANILVLVYPGTYTNDTINFTANGQSVIGVGTYAKHIVTAADAAVVNFAAYTGCFIRDMTVRVTAATSAIATVNGSTGTIFLYDSAVEMTNSNVATAAQPCCIKTTGAATVTFINGFLNYTNNVATTAGAGIKTAVCPALNSTTTFRRAAITIAGAGASKLIIPIYGEATCTTQFYRCRITVTDLDTTAAIGFSYINGASGTGENYSNTCHVTCGAGAGHEADGLVAVGIRNIRSMFNYINLTGNAQYPFQVDSGCTVVSEFDDIVSTGASITSGTGVLKFINSVTDGTLKVSGNILVYENITMAAGKTVDGVDISALASTFGNVTANGTVGRIPQFATSTNITNSIMTGNTTAITVNGNLQMGTTGNITLAAGMTVDGVDISTLSAGSANVTYTQATADVLPKWSAAGNLVNSTISSNATSVYVSNNLQVSGNLTSNLVVSPGITIDGVDVSADDLIMQLMRRVPLANCNQLYIRTTTGSAWGWALPGSNSLFTGTTTGSIISADTTIYAIGVLNNYANVDWRKDYDFLIFFSMGNQFGADAIRNLQIKETTSSGNMTVSGVGVQIFNNALYAESYGSGGRNSVNLATIIPAWHNHVVWIKHRGSVPYTSWYFDNFTTPLYTETNSTKIPYANGGAATNFVMSCFNGAGTADVQMLFPALWAIGKYN